MITYLSKPPTVVLSLGYHGSRDFFITLVSANPWMGFFIKLTEETCEVSAQPIVWYEFVKAMEHPCWITKGVIACLVEKWSEDFSQFAWLAQKDERITWRQDGTSEGQDQLAGPSHDASPGDGTT